MSCQTGGFYVFTSTRVLCPNLTGILGHCQTAIFMQRIMLPLSDRKFTYFLGSLVTPYMS